MSKNGFLSGTQADLQNTLDEVNRKMEEEETRAQAATLGLPYIDLHNFPVDLNVLGVFAEEEARECGAVPFYKELTDLRIGATNPRHPLLQEKVRELSAKNKIKLYVISKRSLAQAMRFYRKVLRPKALRDDTIRVGKEPDYLAEFKILAAEGEQQKRTVSDLLGLVFGAGLFFRASDIHLEPEEHIFKLRFRVDGVLQDMLHFGKEMQKPLTSRLKIMSGLKLNVESAPQDGRLTFDYLGKPVDVRLSVLPSAYGEEIVMRLLGAGAVSLKVEELGFRPEVLAKVQEALDKPNGMIVTTGPTGSGKTTTLYAFLNQLNQPGVKIITLEDPVEYKLPGVVQTPIDHSVDFDFAKGLRAVLRQDPDIVMVGEIRDRETAETALQAALTGHQVFSTLHTNDAAGAIPRLINMGIKPFVIGPALSLVIAQRLVRKICPACKKPAALSPTVMEKINYAFKQIPRAAGIRLPRDLQFYHAPGCAKCKGLGYQGRVGIYEVMIMDEAVQKLTMAEASMMAFKKAAQEQGAITMLQDGLLKALEGITDPEEVFRVAG